MKKLTSLLLAVLLVFSLTVPAFAAEDDDAVGDGYITINVQDLESMDPGLVDTSFATDDDFLDPFFGVDPDDGLLISPAPKQPPEVPFAGVLVVNGEVVDTSMIPDAPGVPLEALAEADHGSYTWDEWSLEAYTYLEGSVISVSEEGAVSIDFEEPVEGITGVITEGSAFVPVALFELVDGYSVVQNGERLEVTTPHANDSELLKLAYQLKDVAGCAASFQDDLVYFLSNYDVEAEGWFEECYCFLPFMINPDALVLAKVTKAADVEALKGALEAYRAGQEETFTWYLSHNLYKVEEAQILSSGDYIMLLIADDSAAGAELFQAFAKAHSPSNTYTVKKGDTMGQIAVNFYGSYGYHQALYRANAEAFAATKGKLLPGMVLTLPDKLGSAARIEAPVARAGETLYTVKRGDTLGKIALATYGKMSEYKAIFERNSDRLKNASTIYEGQVIVLPAK